MRAGGGHSDGERRVARRGEDFVAGLGPVCVRGTGGEKGRRETLRRKGGERGAGVEKKQTRFSTPDRRWGGLEGIAKALPLAGEVPPSQGEVPLQPAGLPGVPDPSASRLQRASWLCFWSRQ